MPHKCVKCDLLYGDDAPEVMMGCACGAKVFLFVRPTQVANAVSIRNADDGAYDIDVGWLFGKEQDARIVSMEDGRYEIDLAASFGRPNA